MMAVKILLLFYYLLIKQCLVAFLVAQTKLGLEEIKVFMGDKKGMQR